MKKALVALIAVAIVSMGAYKFAAKKPAERKLILVLNEETYNNREHLTNIAIASPFGHGSEIDDSQPVAEIKVRGMVVRLAKQYPTDRNLYCNLLGEESKVLSLEQDRASVPANERRFWRSEMTDRINSKFCSILITYGTAEVAETTLKERASKMKG